MWWNDPIVWFVSLVATLLSLVLMRRRPVDMHDPQAEFMAARAVLARPRIDPETGEAYAYKLTRIPVDMPMSNAAPRIIDPLQRKQGA